MREEKPNIDYSAFTTYGRGHKYWSPSKILQTILIFAAGSFVLFMIASSINIAEELIVSFLGFVYLALLLGGIPLLYIFFFKPKHKRMERLFKEFAIANQFTYISSQELNDTIALLHVETNGRGSLRNDFEFIVQGTHHDRRFELGIASVTHNVRGGYGSVRYAGLLIVTLNQHYAHIIADRLHRNWWSKANTTPLPTQQAGYQLYRVQDAASNLLPPQDVFARFLEAVAPVSIDIEITGNKLYAIQKDGLQLTTENMAKLFQLIKDIDIFDQQNSHAPQHYKEPVLS